MFGRKWMPFDISDTVKGIQASIERFDVPIVYLDSFCFVEMAKEKAGISKDSHQHEYGQLRELLSELLSKKKIVCPIGLQEEEIGSSKMHSEAKEAILEYTNIDFLHPFAVQEEMANIAYDAFIRQLKTISFPLSLVTKDISEICEGLRVHVSPVYNRDKLMEISKKKDTTAEKLNQLSKNHSSKDYPELFNEELKGERIAFDYRLSHCCDSPESLFDFFQEVKRIKLSRDGSLQGEDNFMEEYRSFLASDYHSVIPYVWIQSIYWAKHRSQNDTYKPSDRNDILWVAAYLPFTDLCFTDRVLCHLLNDTILPGQLSTKLFSVKTFGIFLDELKSLL